MTVAVSETSTVGQNDQSGAELEARSERPTGGLWIWAALGLAGVVFMLAVWLPWLLSPKTGQPAPGPDPYHYMPVLVATEVVSSAVFVILLWWSLIRPLRAGRGLTVDGKLFIGGTVASSLDIFYAMFNPTWAMNAHAISLGTWSTYIPGYANPNQNHNAWGLLWCLPAYIWLGLGASIVGTHLLRVLRSRFERMSNAAAYVIVLATFYVVFAVIENIWLRTHVYDFVSVPSALTLWAGKLYQFPVYDPLLIGLYCLSYTWLKDSARADGRCAVDRDVANVRAPRWARTVLSVLAVSGYAGATTLICYQVPWDWLSMTAGAKSFPVLPSYLRSGMECGQPGEPLCASEYLQHLRDRSSTGR